MSLQDNLFKERAEKKTFEQAKKYAFRYMDEIDSQPVYPERQSLDDLQIFHEPLPQHPSPATSILELLDKYGAPATVAQTGGRYFGFVNGNALPVSLATKWLTDVWDQCSGLYLTSPINAELEQVCESWLKELFQLPEETVAGFVSGTSMANLSALSAARYRLLMNQGWDINKKGLIGSPGIRIIAHTQVHASIRKTLALLGFGHDNIEWITSDDQGRAIPDTMPELDNRCLVLLQAGNVNTGVFDPFEEICRSAVDAGAWVHIDGAFGLWARACTSLSHLAKGMELADSWAVDGHKTLNTPYDSGIILCRDAPALVNSLQATGAYIQYTQHREPILYGPEMSKRARAIELWAVLKYLGRSGVNELVTKLHVHAKELSVGLKSAGFVLLNEVVFNQVLFRAEEDHVTQAVLSNVQESGKCWCGGTTWQDRPAIRMSICSWATTTDDIKEVTELFKEQLNILSR